MPPSNSMLPSVQALNQQLTDLSLARDVSAGMAAQLIAQSTALVVASGAQYVQGVASVGLAAMSTFTAGAVAQTASTGDPDSPKQFVTAMNDMQTVVQNAGTVFKTLGQDAADVVTAFKNA